MFIYYGILYFRHILESLTEENAYLHDRIHELNRQLLQSNDELRELQADNYQLRSRNDSFSQENEDLRSEVERLRVASQSSQPLQLGDEEEIIPSRSYRSKGKKPVREVESEEDDDERVITKETRVHLLLQIYISVLLKLTFYYFL